MNFNFIYTCVCEGCMDIKELFDSNINSNSIRIPNKSTIHLKNKTKRVGNPTEDKLLGKMEIKGTKEEDIVLKNKDMYVSPAGQCANEIYKDAKSSEITEKERKRLLKIEKKENEKKFAAALGITIIDEDDDDVYIHKQDLFKYLREGIKQLISKKEDIPIRLFDIVGNPDDLQYYEDNRIVNILNRYEIPIYSNQQLRNLFFTLYKYKKLYKYLIDKNNINKILIILGKKVPESPKIDIIEGMRAYVIMKKEFAKYIPNVKFRSANEILSWYSTSYTDNTVARELPCNLRWIDNFLEKHNIKIFDKGRGCFDIKHDDVRIGLLQLFVTNGYCFDN